MIRKSLLTLAAVITAGLAVPAEATEAFQVSVTRTAADTYTVDGRTLRLTTKACAVQANKTVALMVMSGETGSLVFDAKHKCAITAVETAVTKTAGVKAPAPETFTKISLAAHLAAADVLKAMGNY